MKIDDVLKLGAGAVVCVENSATITITGKDDAKKYQPSFPEGTPPLSAQYFADLYKHKNFEAAKPARTGAKD